MELRRQIEENNTSSDAEFVLVPFGFQRDTTIKVSDKEVQDYYNAHKENYRQTASRDVEFVAYEVVPSEADIKAAEEEINSLYDEFAATDNLKAFLSFNSDTPLQDYYYKEGELAGQFPEVDEFAFSRNPKVLPVFQKENTFYAARVNDVKNMSDSAYVRHILLSFEDGALADSLLNVLNHGGDFSDLASRFSLDQNPNVANPGDIGWMTQTSMIPGMQDVPDHEARCDSQDGDGLRSAHRYCYRHAALDCEEGTALLSFPRRLFRARRHSRTSTPRPTIWPHAAKAR